MPVGPQRIFSMSRSDFKTEISLFSERSWSERAPCLALGTWTNTFYFPHSITKIWLGLLNSSYLSQLGMMIYALVIGGVLPILRAGVSWKWWPLHFSFPPLSFSPVFSISQPSSSWNIIREGKKWRNSQRGQINSGLLAEEVLYLSEGPRVE